MPIKLTLVSPNSHFYWNIAIPRAIVPEQLSAKLVFQDIPPCFKQYRNGQFEFILGSAETFDGDAETVTGLTAAGKKIIDYNILILATGSSVKSKAPFKRRGSTQETKKTLHDFQERVKNAGSIVIVGGGPTGVETAGELVYAHGSEKEVTLITSGVTLLEGALPSVSKTALKHLGAFKVNVKLQTKISEGTQLPGGRHEFTLSNELKIVTDLYVSATSIKLKSSYVPNNLLDSKGFVLVDEYLKVKGVKDVWAAGDVSAYEAAAFLNTEAQAAHVAKSVLLILNGKEPLKYSGHLVA